MATALLQAARDMLLRRGVDAWIEHTGGNVYALVVALPNGGTLQAVGHDVTGGGWEYALHGEDGAPLGDPTTTRGDIVGAVMDVRRRLRKAAA